MGLTFLDNKRGASHGVERKVTEETKTARLQEKIVEQECPPHVRQHMLGLCKAGSLLLALPQWWSWNALMMEINLYSVIYF